MSSYDSTVSRSQFGIIPAVVSVIIWSTLAVSVTYCQNVSPMFITGAALFIGGLIGLPWFRLWAMPRRLFVLGTFCMLAYHVIYFYALQLADPIGVSLLHYLWPVLIVVMAPLFVSSGRLTTRSILAGLVGFVGAVISCNPDHSLGEGNWLGYGLAFVSAILWAAYSLLAKQYTGVRSASVGLFCLVSGAACLLVYRAGAQWPSLTPSETWAIVYMGLGPMGGAFYLWDYAMKKANHEQVAVLSYATPVLSTAFLAIYLQVGMQWYIWVGAGLVVCSMIMSRRATS
ncbi:EamA family transporter [Pseudomonas sp. TH21]|uniref:DMT family transporter n=2 Tax=unclassified Pseudomonas TaxID=196821 RepID=UPI0019135C8F|nr:EamA family transporter [Pseudomonas sp. TH21]MBK5477237.1 EamA family transporter [Pseudomonas sp. TH21]